MTSPERVLTIARSQLGTTEDAHGRTRYGAWYGTNGVAWCQIFVDWVFAQAGAAALVPRTAYTPTAYQWFADHGQAGKTPRPGALCFFNWPDSVHRIQHVGLVESVEPNAIVTIEGNTTAPGRSGNQSAGGGVWRRRRARNASIVGYGYPAYAAGSPGGAAIRQGDTGPEVVALQKFLNAEPWRPALPLLKVDGDYGPATRAVVRAAQQQCGIADGDGTVVGPKTRAAFAVRGFRG